MMRRDTAGRRAVMSPGGSPRRVAPAILVLAAIGTGPGPRAEEPPDDRATRSLATRSGEDWGGFLGPTANGRSGLERLARPWPPAGPPILWSCELGEGYGPPAVALGRAVVFDRIGAEARIRCLHAETGQPLWESRYATAYTDMFGYDGGPRSGPVIAHGRVVTFGVEGRLECRRLDTGERLWSIDTARDYHVVQNFFGVGAAPLVIETAAGPMVIAPVGGSPPGVAPPAPERLDLVRGLDSGLVAFELATGRERWRAADGLAGYSSPMTMEIDGETRVIAWLREGLVVVDPATGAEVVGGFRWRADELFSVVAANPVVSGRHVLLSETYGPGSVLLEVATDGIRRLRGDPRGKRPTQALRAHWATPVLHDGHLYGVSGRNSGDAVLVCVEWRTGDVRWSEGGFGRAGLVLADGHLVVLGEFGDLAVVRATPTGYDEVSRARLLDPQGRSLLEPPCWAAPVIARGLGYVRGRGRLVCIELEAMQP
jgi:outer membrane protein assembly factor BamB